MTTQQLDALARSLTSPLAYSPERLATTGGVRDREARLVAGEGLRAAIRYLTRQELLYLAQRLHVRGDTLLQVAAGADPTQTPAAVRRDRSRSRRGRRPLTAEEHEWLQGVGGRVPAPALQPLDPDVEARRIAVQACAPRRGDLHSGRLGVMLIKVSRRVGVAAVASKRPTLEGHPTATQLLGDVATSDPITRGEQDGQARRVAEAGLRLAQAERMRIRGATTLDRPAAEAAEVDGRPAWTVRLPRRTDPRQQAADVLTALALTRIDAAVSRTVAYTAARIVAAAALRQHGILPPAGVGELPTDPDRRRRVLGAALPAAAWLSRRLAELLRRVA